jgi:uncharacterized membrane protein YedE/YeeE
MDLINAPWPWYISGLAIALIMLLLQLSGKKFGMSSNLRTLCTLCGADKKVDFFNFDWKSQRWNLVVVAGAIIGGALASQIMTSELAVPISSNTIEKLKTLGFESAGEAYLPTELFSTESLSNPKTILVLFFGGLLVGFGARYAGGCTSGHAISGLSNFQLPSLLAVVGFFIGGLMMVHLFYPLIF